MKKKLLISAAVLGLAFSAQSVFANRDIRFTDANHLGPTTCHITYTKAKNRLRIAPPTTDTYDDVQDGDQIEIPNLTAGVKIDCDHMITDTYALKNGDLNVVFRQRTGDSDNNHHDSNDNYDYDEETITEVIIEETTETITETNEYEYD